jgi:endonuclease/exonuclease/phosphatase family metal-dependent hydrolase
MKNYNFKLSRKYPNYLEKEYINNDMLIKQYKENNRSFEHLNNNIKKCSSNNIRIMLYNVHFWTNCEEKNSMKEIINVIQKVNPDILCINEATIGKTKYNDYDVSYEIEKIADPIKIIINLEKKELSDKYEQFVGCNVVPSWFNAIYGNIIYIKKSLKQRIMKYFAGLSYKNTIYNKFICGYKNKCNMGQMIMTYNDLECCNTSFINNVYPLTSIGTKETRCFIKFSLPDFDIIFTHLEAYNKEKRLLELKELNNNIIKTTIILGDFNTILLDDYTEDQLKQWINAPNYDAYKTTSCIDKNIFDSMGWTNLDTYYNINMTTWNGTKVDHIFIKYVNDFEFIKEYIEKYNLDSENIVSLSTIYLYLEMYNNIFHKLYDTLSKIENKYYFLNGIISVLDKLQDIKYDTLKKIINNRSLIYLDIDDIYFEFLGLIVTFVTSFQYINNINKSYIKMLNNKINIYFSDASDHLPLILDIETNIISKENIINFDLFDIETKHFFIENQFVELTVNEFITTWNKINNTSNSIDNFVGYNGQPLDAYNWFNANSYTNTFTDPYNYGNAKGSNSLGNIGIYLANNFDIAKDYGYGFCTTYNKDKNIIIYEFKINFTNDIKILYVGQNMEWINYDDKFDGLYDIIVGEHFREFKITQKNFKNNKNTFLSVDSIYTSAEINIKDFTFHSFENNFFKYKPLRNLKIFKTQKNEYINY